MTSSHRSNDADESVAWMISLIFFLGAVMEHVRPTQSPFTISSTPTRLGSVSFAAIAVFNDNSYATTTLNYNVATQRHSVRSESGERAVGEHDSGNVAGDRGGYSLHEWPN